MKLLTYPPRVQSVGGVRVQSVALRAGWDLTSRVSRLKRKSNPLPLLGRVWNPLLKRVRNDVVVHLWNGVLVHRGQTDVVIPRRAQGATLVVSRRLPPGPTPRPPLPM